MVAQVSGTDDVRTIDRLRADVDSRLAELVADGAGLPPHLDSSMRHSLLAPGKRVRALIALLSAGHHGGEPRLALDAACAVEMVHAASLVLDDLPAMDDSRLRRGLPANHCVYGEGTAILAAIGLMNRAFGVVASDVRLGADERLAIASVLSRAIGADGLIAGQEQDLHSEGGLDTVAGIEDMHGKKTGALFAAAAEIGAILADVRDERRVRAWDFGWRLGVAFQTFDDLLDRFATVDAALKDTGKDEAKPTVVALVGPEEALARARRHLDQALAELGQAGQPSALVFYVAGLGEGLMARLDRCQLESVDGPSGR